MSKVIIFHYPTPEALEKYRRFFKHRDFGYVDFYSMGHGFYGLSLFLTILRDMEYSMSRITRYIDEGFGKGINCNLTDLISDLKTIKHVVGY